MVADDDVRTLEEAIYAVLFKAILHFPKWAYSGVFNGKFKSPFDRKPNQISPLGIRVEPDLHAIGFKQKDIVQSSISVTPPWLLDHPYVCLLYTSPSPRD